MVDYENYEELVNRKFEEKKNPKKMPKQIEDRNRGRKLNHRTKKNKAKEL